MFTVSPVVFIVAVVLVTPLFLLPGVLLVRRHRLPTEVMGLALAGPALIIGVLAWHVTTSELKWLGLFIAGVDAVTALRGAGAWLKHRQGVTTVTPH